MLNVKSLIVKIKQNNKINVWQFGSCGGTANHLYDLIIVQRQAKLMVSLVKIKSNRFGGRKLWLSISAAEHYLPGMVIVSRAVTNYMST